MQGPIVSNRLHCQPRTRKKLCSRRVSLVHVFSLSHTIPAGLAVRLQIATGTRAQQIDTLACLHEPFANPRRLLAGVWGGVCGARLGRGRHTLVNTVYNISRVMRCESSGSSWNNLTVQGGWGSSRPSMSDILRVARMAGYIQEYIRYDSVYDYDHCAVFLTLAGPILNGGTCPQDIQHAALGVTQSFFGFIPDRIVHLLCCTALAWFMIL